MANKKYGFFNRNWPWMLGIVIAVIAAALVYYFYQVQGVGGNNSNDPDGVAATVNGVEITNAEVDAEIEAFRSYYEQQGYITADDDDSWVEFLESAGYTEESFREYIITYDLGLNILLSEAAEKEGVEVDDEELDNTISLYVQMYGAEDEEALATTMGYESADDMRAAMKQSMLQEALYEQVVGEQTPTDSDLQTYLEENASSYTGRASYNIVCGANQKEYAQGLLDRINNGEDFMTVFEEAEKVAETYTSDSSDDSEDSDEETVEDADKKVIQASDIGWDCQTSLIEEYTTALNELSKGEWTTELVESDYGYHIIYCYDEYVVGDDETPQVADLPETLRSSLESDCAESLYNTACESYRQSLIDSATIEIK